MKEQANVLTSSERAQELLKLEKKIRMYEGMLNRISPEVCSVIDLDNFLRATVSEIGRVMEVDRCSFAVHIQEDLFRISYEYRSLQQVSERDKLGQIPSSLEQEFSLDAYLNDGQEPVREAVAFDDTTAPDVPPSLQQWCRQIKARALMIIPVKFRNELLGLIILHHCLRPHQWTDDEINFMNSMAQQIAIAYQYTKLYKEKEKEVEITKTLLDIASDLNSKLDLHEITSFIVEKSMELFKADYGCIGVFDEREKTLHFKAARERVKSANNIIERNPVSLADMPHILNAINSQQTFFLSDPDRDLIARTYLKEIFHGRAALIAPIVKGDKVFGTLNLIWMQRGIPITSHEIKLIEGIASQTALALENMHLSSELVLYKRKEKGIKASEFIIGQSEKLKKCIDMALYVADGSTTVLLQGESGTGKELIADLIYLNSSRAGRPYIKINCGAIPETLIETELFGYEKGAFTDAKGRRIGKFEEANGGTLFLDEVGELSANAQVKLLRVLQHGEFTRVGGNEVIKTDVRVIAATNVDLAEAVEKGKFRKDLYYRLNVYPITLPPLRERIEDIPHLVMYFISIYNSKNNRNIAGISPTALNALKAYHWPGNVRELENAIERAVIVAKSRSITFEDLPDTVQKAYLALGESPKDLELQSSIHMEIGTPLEEVERQVILKTLDYVGGDKSKAARLLGIGRKTLYRKLKKYSSGS